MITSINFYTYKYTSKSKEHSTHIYALNKLSFTTNTITPLGANKTNKNNKKMKKKSIFAKKLLVLQIWILQLFFLLLHTKNTR